MMSKSVKDYTTSYAYGPKIEIVPMHLEPDTLEMTEYFPKIFCEAKGRQVLFNGFGGKVRLVLKKAKSKLF